jgi:tetratricopeptide (TPR) repeat protein
LVARAGVAADLDDVAIEFLNRCLDDNKFPIPPRIHYELVDLLWQNRRYDEVITASERAEKANPLQKLLFVEFRTRAMEAQGRAAEALAVLDQLEKEHKSADDVISIRLAAARIHLQQESFDKAVEVCRSILADFPANGQVLYARYLLATVLGQKGELEEFEKIVKELLADSANLPPTFVATLQNDLGYTWADHDRNLDEAETLIRKALDLKPDEPAYLDSLGWVLFKQGDFEGALASLKKAAAMPAGQDPVIFEHLGDAYLKANDHNEAKKAWGKALELLSKTETVKAKEQRTTIEKKMKLLAEETTDAR